MFKYSNFLFTELKVASHIYKERAVAMHPKRIKRGVYGENEVTAIVRAAQRGACYIMAGAHVQKTALVDEPYLLLSPEAEDASVFLFSLRTETDVLLCVGALFRLLSLMHAERTYHLEAKLPNFVFSNFVGRPEVNVHVMLSDGSVWYVYAIDFETMFMIDYNEDQKRNFDMVCNFLEPYGYTSFDDYVQRPEYAERSDTFAMLVTIGLFVKVNKATRDPRFRRLYERVLMREINPTGQADHRPKDIPEATGGKRTYSYFYVTGAPIKPASEIAASVRGLLRRGF